MTFPKTFFIGLPLVVLLVPVLLSIRGAEVNYSDKTIRKWIWYYGFKIGKRISYNNFTYAELRNYYSCHSMGCESISGTYIAKTFEIVVGGPGMQKIIITEIPDYHSARKALEDFCAQSGLELVDSWKIRMDQASNLSQATCDRRY